MDNSATVEEVAESLAKARGCVQQDIKVGDIRRQPNGLGSCWAKCPVAATRAILATPRILVGWSSCRAVLLPCRGLQCFKCLEPGHVQAHCTSAVTRTGCCYRCGGLGHLTKNREAEGARCPACEALGRPHRHRIGGSACTAAKKGKKGGKSKPSSLPKTGEQPPVSATTVAEVEMAAAEERPISPVLGSQPNMEVGSGQGAVRERP
ncbi:PREDICTED: uncharacterized protein LOC108766488 [Trachymyrmex cornetzi]|uniref:uncharacterized protein LOC108766488 n=1 Tax=Trachymyrmex cornetzi TaxID=471704 RepID=UPI00084ED2F4|nr:PREDICTED: uncharacterized protein LOC108766488 [Trachymyrmex cornetzi]